MNLKTSVSRKQSTPNFPKIEHFLPPDTHTYVYVSGGKKCSFFGKFGVLYFLETPVFRFALLPYYRRNHKHQNIFFKISIESWQKKLWRSKFKTFQWNLDIRDVICSGRVLITRSFLKNKWNHGQTHISSLCIADTLQQETRYCRG